MPKEPSSGPGGDHTPSPLGGDHNESPLAAALRAKKGDLKQTEVTQTLCAALFHSTMHCDNK